MKRSTILAGMLGTLLLSSCGLTGTQLLNNPNGTGTLAGTNNTTTNVLGSVLTGLLGGSTTVSQQDIVGTWNYSKADCVFETENLLLKAGGEVAAASIESKLETQLAKVGIKKGSCSYTFNSDGTYKAVIGGYNISGNYTLDSSKQTITMTYLGGLGRITPHITKSAGSISLLYESDKLLSMVQKVGKLSSNSAVNGLSDLLGAYDGLLVGMQLTKK